MLVNLVALFLGLSVLFYALFAGADFGGGILELFLGPIRREEQRELIRQAIAPVWEANHVWIILAVVILFNGFPLAYSQIATNFHIPLLTMLFGIILRGSAFTFGRYDAVKDRSQKYYWAIFNFSSFVTPLFLGMIAGGLYLGRVSSSRPEFYETFIGPWFNLFCFSVGLFLCALFSFLAAVYLVGETTDHGLRKIFIKKALVANVVTVLTGLLVFVTAHIDGLQLVPVFLKNPLSLAAMILATVTLWPLWRSLNRQKVLGSRIFAAAQVTFVLLGWYALQYPVLMHRRVDPITIMSSQAPEATLRVLLGSLVVGVLLIFPALIYLLVIFKTQEVKA